MAAGYVKVLPASAVETVLFSVKNLYGNGSKDTSKKSLKKNSLIRKCSPCSSADLLYTVHNSLENVNSLGFKHH